MITRIVQLPIDPEKLDEFLRIFKRIKREIKQQAGCKSLEIYENKDTPGMIFTHSIWDNEESLNAYRNSELFNSTWPAVKLLFNSKPQAWTLMKL